MLDTKIRNRIFCTFLEPEHLEKALERLREVYKETKFYILFLPQEERFAISYTLPKENTLLSLESRTISVHRKKGFNTLYTINALNKVVEIQNNGVKDSKFEVDWSPYKNSILVLSPEGDLKKIDTKLLKVI